LLIDFRYYLEISCLASLVVHEAPRSAGDPPVSNPVRGSNFLRTVFYSLPFCIKLVLKKRSTFGQESAWARALAPGEPPKASEPPLEVVGL